MQHIFNFAIELEDEKIVERISQNAEKQVIKEIGDHVKDCLFQKSYSYKTYQNEPNGHFTAAAKDIMSGWLTDHKDEIISKTAELLAKKLAMTKAAKAIQEEA